MMSRIGSLVGVLVAVGCGQNQPQQPFGIPGQTGVPGMTVAPMTGVPMTAVPMTAAPLTAAPLTTQITPTTPAGDYLQNRMNEIYGRFGEGKQPVSPLFRGNLGTQQTQEFAVTLQNGHCYILIGVGSPSVTDLDLFLFDPNGMQVSRDEETDNFPIVRTCPPVSGAYRVQAKMYSGAGEFGLQVFGT